MRGRGIFRMQLPFQATYRLTALIGVADTK